MSSDAAATDSAAAQAAAAAAAAAAAVKAFAIEAWTLLAIGILFTMLRTYARARAVGFKGLQADDYLVWVGVVSFSISWTLTCPLTCLKWGRSSMP